MNPQHLQMQPEVDKFLSFSASFVILDHTLLFSPPVKSFVFNPSHEFYYYLLSYLLYYYLLTLLLSV